MPRCDVIIDLQEPFHISCSNENYAQYSQILKLAAILSSGRSFKPQVIPGDETVVTTPMEYGSTKYLI